MDYFYRPGDPPWPNQLDCFKFAADKPGVGVFHRMGGGKSKFAIDYAYNMRAKRTIVLCNKTVIQTWLKQFYDHWPQPESWPPYIFHFDEGRSLQDKLNRCEWTHRNALADGRPFVLIINYEAFWRQPVRPWILSKSWDLGVADECQELSTPGSKQSKAAAILGHLCHKRLGLSGTPLRKGPLNAYGIYRFLNSNIYGTNYQAFKQRYAITDPKFPSKVWKYINVEDFNRRFGSIAHQWAGDPPCKELDLERVAPLAGEARRVYDELYEQFCAEVKGGRVTPQNAAVRLLRLQQVTSGFVGDDGGKVVQIGDEKAMLLKEVLDELPDEEPIVIWCRFHHDLDRVHEVAHTRGTQSLELSGRRNELAAWSNAQAPILAAQISTGVGINDLVRAKYSIDYSVGYSLLDYIQHRGRFNREGQKSETVYYIRLLTDAKVDRAVYTTLAHNGDVVATFMEMAERETGAAVENWK